MIELVNRFNLERRQSQASAELTFQYERLQRRVNLRQQVFTSLSELCE